MTTSVLDRIVDGASDDRHVPAIVGIDDGYAQTKAYAGPGRQICFSTLVKQGPSHLTDGRGENTVAASYKTDDMLFTIDGLDGEETSHDKFHTSVLDRVAVHHALHRLQLDRDRAKICVGLPFSDYFAADKSLNRALVTEKIQNLSKPVLPQTVNARQMQVLDVRVIAQGLAAFFDFTFDDDLKPKEDKNAPTLIVDIGGRTTDIAYVKDGQMVDHRISESLNIGVLDVHRNVAQRVATQLGIRDTAITQDMREKLVRHKKLRARGEEHDVSEIVALSTKEVSDQIQRFIDKKLNAALDAERILFAGGGGALFTQLRAQYKFAADIQEPEFANARGMYKFMMQAGK